MPAAADGILYLTCRTAEKLLYSAFNFLNIGFDGPHCRFRLLRQLAEQDFGLIQAGGNPAAARDLIEAIEQDRQPKCSMYEARGAIEMVLAVFESHRQNAPVVMPLDCKDNPLSRL